jgi:hypothetical protein
MNSLSITESSGSNRVSQAIKPQCESIANVARNAPVGHVDKTSWRRKAKLVWLWGLASSRAALFMIHSRRSNAAFEKLVQRWSGILVADGYAVHRQGVGLRQACLAHLVREAEGAAEARTQPWPSVKPGRETSLGGCAIWQKPRLPSANGGRLSRDSIA